MDYVKTKELFQYISIIKHKRNSFYIIIIIIKHVICLGLFVVGLVVYVIWTHFLTA